MSKWAIAMLPKGSLVQRLLHVSLWTAGRIATRATLAVPAPTLAVAKWTGITREGSGLRTPLVACATKKVIDGVQVPVLQFIKHEFDLVVLRLIGAFGMIVCARTVLLLGHHGDKVTMAWWPCFPRPRWYPTQFPFWNPMTTENALAPQIRVSR